MNNNIRIAGQANSNDLILDVKNIFLTTMLVVPEGPIGFNHLLMHVANELYFYLVK